MSGRARILFIELLQTSQDCFDINPVQQAVLPGRPPARGPAGGAGGVAGTMNQLNTLYHRHQGGDIADNAQCCNPCVLLPNILQLSTAVHCTADS